MASGTELAKAYVQIVPSANGIKGSIEQAMGGEAERAGTSIGNTLASKIKIAVVAAGIGKAISSSIMEGADLQQSIGGIETLFKDSANKMKEYANQAYRTAGLSANDFMEQSTSFAASLLQSLGGNTKKAADAANQALIDMSDNSNKMGTSMELIQNAYQGFAKQNYTMLDNLKLGYGGTKTEMERLLSDAQKLTGVKYDISNLSDVYSAIHVIQKELGITGTTAKEASETFTGSFSAMKAALSNFLGSLSLGQDIMPSLNALLSTTATFLFNNLLPMVGNVIRQIPTIFSTVAPQLAAKGMDMLLSLSSGFVNGFPLFVSTTLNSIQNFANSLSEQAPVFINKGFELLSNLVQGIVNAIPIMIQKLPLIITTFANIINDNFPTILIKGTELLWEFIKGILSAIPTLVQNIPAIIEAIWSTILAFNWLNLGKTIITGFGNGIKSMVGFVKNNAKSIFDSIVNTLKNLPSNLLYLGSRAMSSLGGAIKAAVGMVKSAASSIVNAIVNTIKSIPSKMVSIGRNIVEGLFNGISNMTGWIIDKIGGFADSVLDSIKGFFGIHSPSRVFRDEVGKMLTLGMAEGIENNLNPVKSAMNQLTKETVGVIDTNVNISSSNLASIQNDNNTALQTIISLLQMLVSKNDNGEIVLNIGNREFARILKEMGVVFS